MINDSHQKNNAYRLLSLRDMNLFLYLDLEHLILKIYYGKNVSLERKINFMFTINAYSTNRQ